MLEVLRVSEGTRMCERPPGGMLGLRDGEALLEADLAGNAKEPLLSVSDCGTGSGSWVLAGNWGAPGLSMMVTGALVSPVSREKYSLRSLSSLSTLPLRSHFWSVAGGARVRS